jgi:hypothetical protein
MGETLKTEFFCMERHMWISLDEEDYQLNQKIKQNLKNFVFKILPVVGLSFLFSFSTPETAWAIEKIKSFEPKRSSFGMAETFNKNNPNVINNTLFHVLSALLIKQILFRGTSGPLCDVFLSETDVLVRGPIIIASQSVPY